jgi:hypothetical protein
VPQGSLLSPLLYTLYIYVLPTTKKTTIRTFADDTAIFAIHDNPVTASSHLQEDLSLIEAWLNKWKIKVNESKFTQTTFTLRKGSCPPVQINHINIPLKNQVQYLGLTFLLQTELETTYNEEEKTNGPKTQRNQLAHRKKFLPLH